MISGASGREVNSGLARDEEELHLQAPGRLTLSEGLRWASEAGEHLCSCRSMNKCDVRYYTLKKEKLPESFGSCLPLRLHLRSHVPRAQ